jgi:hypothetical protein
MMFPVVVEFGPVTHVGQAIVPVVVMVPPVMGPVVAMLDTVALVVLHVGHEIVPVVVIVPPLMGDVVAMLVTVPVVVVLHPKACVVVL